MDNRYIGVFDSGIGGLTTVRHLMKILPRERILFFGDTARTPYGSKSGETIRKFSFQIGDFLKAHDVKMMAVACNTISSVALQDLRERYPDIPVVGTIGPTSRNIEKSCSKDDRIGILATKATVSSGAYPKKIHEHAPEIQHIYQKACPIFVPLIEEGVIDHPIMDMAIRYYLDPFLKEYDINKLVLACTHYPLLSANLNRLYPGIEQISSSKEIAIAVKMELEKRNMLAGPDNAKRNIFYASDLSENFVRMIHSIFGSLEENPDLEFKNLEL
ncbi:MAG: glutamate racemase [Eubacteriales bacterium]|nr:glutamate racemase [Eubacteriales bacterium]